MSRPENSEGWAGGRRILTISEDHTSPAEDDDVPKLSQNPSTAGRQNRVITSEAFWPPKPKLLEMAVRTGISLAVLGT